MPDDYSKETIALQETTIQRAIGPTILLGSGSYYDFEAPEDSLMTAEDVAYALGFECRFSGQCRNASTGKRLFYSVAEHCVRMSGLVTSDHKYSALMHEVGEAPCGDMTGPLKSLCPDYRAIEKKCEAAGFKRFSVDMSDKNLMKTWDIYMLAWERRDLMPNVGDPWVIKTHIPLPNYMIEPWGPYEAAEKFLQRFREIAPLEMLERDGLTRF